MNQRNSNTGPLNMAIGFVTGRKNFKNLIKTYFNNWLEDDLIPDRKINLNLLVAYDLKYHNTKVSDYKKIDPEIYEKVNAVDFIGHNVIADEIKQLVSSEVITRKEAQLIFGDGYGKKRNVIAYFALKNKMDYLLFIDDDEYPLAIFDSKKNGVTWRGQSVVSTHLKYIDGAHVTHGHHCGYISPIPHLEFNRNLKEEDFRVFIETISNDIINWDTIKGNMEKGGITFASETVLNRDAATEVKETGGCKFISGSNLCLNLRKAEDLAPFYNPPEARGEDTFLSTCLTAVKVLKVPCYTFHDGFLNYTHLLHGVLPQSLKPVTARSPRIVTRFVRASLGWVRYKPLLLYITRRNDYDTEILRMKENLIAVVPKLCRYFNNNEFQKIHHDLDYYHRNVKNHFYAFAKTKAVWRRLVTYLRETKA
jgi:hypothetical protein